MQTFKESNMKHFRSGYCLFLESAFSGDSNLVTTAKAVDATMKLTSKESTFFWLGFDAANGAYHSTREKVTI